ncbi:MFS transporter [Salinispira pacifica]
MERKRTTRILLVLFFGVLMGALDIAIVGPAMPAIRSTFAAAGDRSLTWIFSAYVLFNLVGTPIMSKLSDIAGRRLIYVIDLSLFALGSLVVAAAPSFLFVLIGRAIQGFGAGGIFPVASAVIGDTFPPERRGSALGLIGAVFGLAFIVGPALAGLILSVATWHWLFIINIPIALTVMGFSIRLLPSSRAGRGRPFDWAGTVTLTLALAAFMYGLNSIDTSRFFGSLLSLPVLPALGAAVLFAALTLLAERRAADPILPAALFGSRQLRIGYALTAGAGVGEAAVVFMPLLAVAAIPGVKENQASFLLLPVVVALAVGSPAVGRLLDRLGSRVVILTGLIITTAGVFLLSLTAGSLTMFIISGAMVGLGLSSLLGAPIRYITLNEVSADNRSAAQGAVTVFTSSGQIFGASIIGAVAASAGGGASGYARAFLVMAFVAVLLLFVAAGLKNRRREAEAAQANSREDDPRTAEAPGGKR